MAASLRCGAAFYTTSIMTNKIQCAILPIVKIDVPRWDSGKEKRMFTVVRFNNFNLKMNNICQESQKHISMRGSRLVYSDKNKQERNTVEMDVGLS